MHSAAASQLPVLGDRDGELDGDRDGELEAHQREERRRRQRRSGQGDGRDGRGQPAAETVVGGRWQRRSGAADGGRDWLRAAAEMD